MKLKRLLNAITATFITTAILLSLFPIYSWAKNDDENNIAEYTLNVYLPKNTVGNISFYPTTGFDNENCDIYDENETVLYDVDSDTDSVYDIYTMTVPEGNYSFRATDIDGKSLGGGIIKAPPETIEDDSSTINAYLRLSKTYITNIFDEEKATSEDFSVTLFNKFGTVTMGDAFIDEKGYTCYPALIYANGNALLYYVTATPSENYASLYQLKESKNSNIAVFKSNKTYNFKLSLTKAVPFTITAPEGAEVFMYNQILNFNTVKIHPVNITYNGNGTYSHEFSYAGDSYRVTMDGKRTQAGYISQAMIDNTPCLNISFPEDETDEQVDTWIGRKESSVLLNINERNKLSLEIGESYKVRAYRAPWQIINTDTDNIMIEPDFHFNIISGDDVISIRQTDGGNAGGNWAEITAENNGVAIIEVSYDAIDVAYGNKTETYTATNPRRTGVFVVTVGDNYGDIPGIDIDSEYHTEYFTGNNGNISVTPQGDNIRVDVANINSGALGAWENIVDNNGVFDIPLYNGNNILKITSDGITDYRIIRASKLETVITNNTNPDRTEEIHPGDRLTISFKGLFQWIPKFSGIYNPSSLYAVYQLGDEVIEGQKSQYDLPESTLDITIPPDAEEKIILTNGRLTGNTLGSVWSAHRQLTDIGVPANFNASTLTLEDLPLPELIIPITIPSEDSEGDTDNGNTPSRPSAGDDDNSDDTDTIDVSDLKFDVSDDEIEGYVTVSFEDNGQRKPNESGVTYKKPIGKIIESAKIPVTDDDTIASVTLRLLKALNIKASYTGTATNNFYLSAIGNFTLNGKYYDSFGEFDSGAASGWMVKHNNWFINMGASEFPVTDGDTIEWLYTCQLGSDIGCDWSNPSAEITGIKFESNYGTLSPSFKNDVSEYTYSVPASTKSISIQAEQENYWSTITYTADGKTYKASEDIPVSDGTVITIESAFSEYLGHTPTDTDIIKITIRKKSDGSGFSSINNEKSPQKEEMKEDITNYTLPFSDINEDDWYYEYVKYVYENNLMQGSGECFEPENNMSRAMLVTVLYRMVSPQKTINTYNFKDVSNDMWYSDAISWAASNGIVNGISKTEFLPDADISREQITLILYRYAKMMGYDTSVKSELSAFTDASDISDWAFDAVRWAVRTGILNGTENKTLSPKASATRSQVAAIIMRFNTLTRSTK